MNVHESVLAPLATLEQLPGLRVRADADAHAGSRATGVVIVEVCSQAGVDHYAAVRIRGVTPRTLPSVVSLLLQGRSRTNLAPLLLADHVPTTVAQVLREERIAFADAAGNAYLDGLAAYVWIVGHRPPTTPARSGLTFTDLLLTFALLREPGLVARPLRDIAATTGVSLGKVSGTLGALEDQRYVARRPQRRRILQDARRLLERWEIGYLEVVRPRLHVTNWRLPAGADLGGVVDRSAEVTGALLGGEHAADTFTRHLKPTTLTLHVQPGQAKLVAARLRLLPDEHRPQVILLNRFAVPLDEADEGSVPQGAAGGRSVHPILARAELLALASARLREVADRLRDDVIVPALPTDG